MWAIAFGRAHSRTPLGNLATYTGTGASATQSTGTTGTGSGTAAALPRVPRRSGGRKHAGRLAKGAGRRGQQEGMFSGAASQNGRRRGGTVTDCKLTAVKCDPGEPTKLRRVETGGSDGSRQVLKAAPAGGARRGPAGAGHKRKRPGRAGVTGERRSNGGGTKAATMCAKGGVPQHAIGAIRSAAWCPCAPSF